MWVVEDAIVGTDLQGIQIRGKGSGNHSGERERNWGPWNKVTRRRGNGAIKRGHGRGHANKRKGRHGVIHQGNSQGLCTRFQNWGKLCGNIGTLF